MMKLMVFSSVFVAVVPVVAVLVLSAISRARAAGCPQCGSSLPAFRRPTSFRQLVWGGWTCPNCGCDIDRHGVRLSEPEAK